MQDSDWSHLRHIVDSFSEMDLDCDIVFLPSGSDLQQLSDDELEKYKNLIKKCGLSIEKLKLTTEDLEENYPELYEELQIELQLDAILDQLDQLKEDEKEIIANIIKENMEITKKSHLPFF